jgi:hypothetical protein
MVFKTMVPSTSSTYLLDLLFDMDLTVIHGRHGRFLPVKVAAVAEDHQLSLYSLCLTNLPCHILGSSLSLSYIPFFFLLICLEHTVVILLWKIGRFLPYHRPQLSIRTGRVPLPPQDTG